VVQTRRATTQKSRSKAPRPGREWRRFKTTTCWRKAKFSRRKASMRTKESNQCSNAEPEVYRHGQHLSRNAGITFTAMLL
jgi:hypothetical protein